MVHRLDPGILPFRKAQQLDIHVSGGEYNVAANLTDCFGLKTGIATANGGLPNWRVGAKPHQVDGCEDLSTKMFKHNGVNGPNIATVYSDRGLGVRPPVVFYNRANEAGGM